MKRKVTVFDSNALNPYGAELAAVLCADGYAVTRWCRIADPFRGKVIQRRVLWASRQQVGLVRALLSRYWGTVLFALVTALRRDTFVIVAWPVGEFELRMMVLLDRLGVPLAYIDHNPLSARSLPSRQERLLERLRAGQAVRVVHSDTLADQLTPRPQVAPHPSYRRWVGHYAASASGTAVRALFLGALRPDKGVNQLPGIIMQLLGRGVSVLVAGRGSMPAPVPTHERLHYAGADRNLSDVEVAAAIRDSSVLLAPYQDVTMSGTILMALTAGLPVAAYDAPTLRAVLPADFLVSSGDAACLAERAAELIESKQNWHAELAGLSLRLDEACAAGWRAILGD